MVRQKLLIENWKEKIKLKLKLIKQKQKMLKQPNGGDLFWC